MLNADIKFINDTPESSDCRRAAAIAAVIVFSLCLNVIRASAQYVPIPNYTGIGAGEQFRNDLNNHLSGTAAVAPRLVPLTYAQLPEEQDGQLFWCEDCQRTTPCLSGGTGGLAIGTRGLWSCSTGGSAANAFPLGSDVSAASHRIENLSTDLSAGDALSRSQSSLNSLASPAAAFSMNGQKLQGLGLNALTGDALSENQSKLTDLAPLTSAYSVNGQKLQNLAAGGVAGDALGFAQSNAQLTHNQPGAYVVSQSTADAGPGTSATITAPASISNGNALVLIIANPQASETYTPPTGFSAIGSSYSNSAGTIIAAFCKTAADESGNYSISWSGSQFYNIILLNIGGTNCGEFDAASGNNGGNVGTNNSISIAGLATRHENDFVIAAAGQNAGSNLSPQIGSQLFAPAGNGFAALSLSNSYGAAPSISFGSSGTGALSARALAFYPSSAITATPIVHGSSGGVVNDLSGSFNGVINVMAPFAPVAASPGTTLNLAATGDGYHDDTAAIQNAVLAACGMASLSSTPMYVHNSHPRIVLPYTGPLGCYRITQPIRLYCGTLDFGSDPGANVWGGHAKLCPNYAGPSVIAEAPAANNLTFASALMGSGNAMSSAGGAPNIVLSDWLNSVAANFNNNTQIGVEMVVNISNLGSTGELFKWQTAEPGLYNTAHQTIVQMSANSSGQTFCQIVTTASGSVSGTSSDTGFSLNASHSMSYDWDGSNLRCFRDGVLVVGPLAATGSLYTSTASGSGLFNVSEEPEQDIGWWPDTSPLNAGSVQGKLDAINISKVALHTAAYTPSSSKPTVNSNTQLLINFEGYCTSVGQANCSTDGTQLAHTGLYSDGSGQMNVFLPLRGISSGAQVPSIHIHDLELCAHPVGVTGYPDGLFAIWAPQSEFDHLSCGSANHTAFNFFDNDWEAWTHDDQVYGNGHALGFELGTQYNECDDFNLMDTGGQVMSVSEGGGATDDERFKHSELGYSVYDWIYNGTKTTASWFFTDMESTSPNHLADFMFENGMYGETIIDGQINTRNGAPYIDVFGGSPPTVIGDQFDTFGQDQYAHEVFNHVDANSNTHLPNGPDLLINALVPKNGATPIPLSNPSNDVIDLGDQNGPGLLLAGAGFVPPPSIFANLGTPANGTEYYCTDCVIASTCAGSGTGAIAKRLNGAWVCN